MANGILPMAGEVWHVGEAAGVQFGGDRNLTVRLIRLQDWSTYEGYRWMDCYVLDDAGDAIERRSLFVYLAGLRPVRRADTDHS